MEGSYPREGSGGWGVRLPWKLLSPTSPTGKVTSHPKLPRIFLLSALTVPHLGNPFGARQTRTVGHPTMGLGSVL